MFPLSSTKSLTSFIILFPSLKMGSNFKCSKAGTIIRDQDCQQLVLMVKSISVKYLPSDNIY